MEGWHARCSPTTPALPWVMPSPNMPTLDTAIVYPGTVLFEGTMCPRAGARRGRSSWSARRGSSGTLRARVNALGLPRRSFPAGRVRADLPQARAQRAAAARFTYDRAGVPPVRDRRRAHRTFRRPTEAVRVAAAALRIRARQAADRHPGRLGRSARADRRSAASRRQSPACVGSGRRGVRAPADPDPYLTVAQ